MYYVLTIVLLTSGWASYYAKGVMPEVYTNRLTWQQIEPCPECLGNVAVLDKELLGQKLWLTLDGITYHGPYLIADCAAQQDYAHLKAKNLVVELSYKTWQELGLPRDLVSITITYVDPKLWHPDYYVHDPTDLRR